MCNEQITQKHAGSASALLNVGVAYGIQQNGGDFVYQSNTAALKKKKLLSFWGFYR